MKLFGFWTELPYLLLQLKNYNKSIPLREEESCKNLYNQSRLLLSLENSKKRSDSTETKTIKSQICFYSIKSAIRIMNHMLKEIKTSKEISELLLLSRKIQNKCNEEYKEIITNESSDFLSLVIAFIEKLQNDLYNKSNNIILKIGEKEESRPIDSKSFVSKKRILNFCDDLSSIHSSKCKSILTCDTDKLLEFNFVRFQEETLDLFE